jgi:3-mercaptopyruvate sulfurtransferase SseA
VTSQVTTVSSSDQATAQALSVGTQVVKDATETAGLPRIEPAEAIAQVNAGSAAIIDVRGRDNYLTGHIKGATNIPESEVSTRLSEFPKLGTLIVYCQ